MYLSEGGVELDAEFSIDCQSAERSIVLESRRGSPPRNVDYNRCLELILERLGKAEGLLVDACVDTSRTMELSRAQRRLKLAHHEYPVNPARVDVTELRRRFNEASAFMVRSPSARGGNPTRRIRLYVDVGALSLTALEKLLQTGDVVGRLTADQERSRMGLGFGPVWAQRWGEDELYGAFASLVVDGVEQRMRWMPPGTFTMGSSEGEPWRVDNETEHLVTLSAGFWIADTPCTQALWTAVMGQNPSEFKSAQRPVERVSWDDVQEFLSRLNQRVWGLAAGLPTEAQWEYACRAGTTTATYAGPLEVLGLHNAPALHDIAWYAGNSGLHWDLDEGWDSSAWDEKQFSHIRAGTRKVRGKQPNPRGLYDLLGNVWEWCSDWYGRYDAGPVADPAGPASGRNRVMRGGSWGADARLVRAASRGVSAPSRYDGILGFRLVRCQGLRQPGEGSDSTTSKGEQARGGDPPGGRPASAQIAVPRRSQSQAQQPRWADAAGRDQYGRWASFHIDDVVQRMRWIEPGTFTMGSPENEPGRRDNETQQNVTLTKGFWIADTPCTQALWEVVTGHNPSQFKSLQRPVEQVSWEDVQAFLAQIDRRRPGLKMKVPTEAQWEYACRAGTTTATYAGPMEILGIGNAPVLDEIAWYSGNSGVGFELAEGYDSANWRQKQYPHERAGTREVALKRPNSWGIYDTLGNVLEWCLDWYSPSAAEQVTDPPGRAGVQNPVLRGGGWGDGARYMRAAFRCYAPGIRRGRLGFRLVRDQ